ncbi:hypothetical protein CU669_20420 [Paramagnetospirillum kuznetsovii]|uniref:Uncharacterized protein n=1 Tax=Paramagnetospirillum kuznetsovii TaxID=2053833 RepID=A0A364NSK7_9PROT|nr:hypothetical protein [Paramagnetospirillum kuznetsovii]RAU20073.1 hypothetical protein CU669_20420 [Paramagnetospirillum kuznetsovii]
MKSKTYPRQAVYAATGCYQQLIYSWRGKGPLALSYGPRLPLSEALALDVARMLSRFSAPKRISLGAGSAAAAVADRDRPGFLAIWRSGSTWNHSVVPEPTAVAGKIVILLDLGIIKAELLEKLNDAA